METILAQPNTLLLFFMASLRMAGMMFFNPIFGRSGIPTMVKVGLSLSLAWAAYNHIGQVDFAALTTLGLWLIMIKEVAVGFFVGFIMRLFLSIFHIGGHVMDLQIGLGMATQYDPGSQSQISLFGNIVTILYSLLFFTTNSHVRFLSIAANSYKILPLGAVMWQRPAAMYVVEMFTSILAYAIQLALPIIVTQIVVEVAVGILMRMVPQINVFVINLQVKLAVGVLVILTVLPMLARYLERLNELMLDRLHAGLTLLL